MTQQSNATPVPQDFEDLLNSTAVAHVATRGPDGEPQSNPVWFDWDGEFVKFSQTRTRQKLRNLNRDPRIALSIVDPDNHLRYLEIRGRVEKIEEDPDLDFISAMSRKYLDTYPYPFHKPGDERVVLFVRPEHTTHMDG